MPCAGARPPAVADAARPPPSPTIARAASPTPKLRSPHLPAAVARAVRARLQCQQVRIDAVGLAPQPAALGEVADPGRIDYRHRYSAPPTALPPPGAAAHRLLPPPPIAAQAYAALPPACLIPLAWLASLARSPLGRTAITNSALLTSIPTYTSSAIAPLLLPSCPRPAPPCNPMLARVWDTALSTVRVADAWLSRRGDPCSPPALSDRGRCAVPDLLGMSLTRAPSDLRSLACATLYL